MFAAAALLCLFSLQSSLSSSLLEQSLFKLLPLEDRLQIISQQAPVAFRHRRSLDGAFMEPMRNLTDVLDPVFNLSTAESDFFQLPTSEFHKRIYNQFDRIQKRVFNESLMGIHDDLERFNVSHFKPEHKVESLHETRPGYERKEETYKIPSKDGVRIVRKGLRKYKDNMENWVEHTFVHKPKSVVQEKKDELQNATAKTREQKVRMDKLKKLWSFEKDFDSLMRKYQKEMTSHVFDRYNLLSDHFMGYGPEEYLYFPSSVIGLEKFMFEDPCDHGGPCANVTHTEHSSPKP